MIAVYLLGLVGIAGAAVIMGAALRPVDGFRFERRLTDVRWLERRVARAFRVIANNPVRWALYSVALGVFGGGTVFSLVESGVSMPDGWWWAFVSMSTVGYGDISPVTPEIRFLAVFVIATGVLAVAIITGAIASEINTLRMQVLLHERDETPDEFHDDMKVIAHELRERADVLDAVSAEVEALHQREQEWVVRAERLAAVVRRVEAHVGDPTSDTFDGGAVYAKRELKKLCGELRTLVVDEPQPKEAV